MGLKKWMYSLLLTQLLMLGLRGQQGANDNISSLIKTVEVIPSTPNASSLGKYGGVNFGLSTGMLSTSIPIYNFSSINLQVPISLSYSSNGFKVDEISSRVGVSWSLNAGGVISRTIYGAVDELSTRINPAYTGLTRTFIDNFLKPVSLSHQSGGYDAQPDIFSFNFGGYTGQFILDNNLHPLSLSFSNLKIEDNYAASNPEWDFKITTPEGVVYFFGGIAAREVTDKNIGGNCGHDLPEFYPVAYYLTKIVHPNNDSILFTYAANGYNYKTAISQNVFYHLSSEFNCSDALDRTCPQLNNYVSSCVTWLRSSGVVLKEINSASGGRVLFKYINRKDVPLDSLLNRVEVYEPLTNKLIRVFDLQYKNNYSSAFSNSFNNSDSTFGYRHFLWKLVERSADASVSKTHEFVYNNLDGLPARLAFSQDHYGFFNGKSNSSFLPKPVSLYEQAYFPMANADRSPYANFAMQGLLSKIIYPTGGSDTIFYEGNSVYGTVATPPGETDFSTTADSQEIPFASTNNSGLASISYNQEVVLNGSCIFYGSSSESDPIHNKAKIFLYDNLDNIVYQKTLLPGEAISSQNIFTLSAGKSYYIKISAYGNKVRASASFSARIGAITYTNSNKPEGGIRVAKVITSGKTGGPDIIKKYYYATHDLVNISSGVSLTEPTYSKTHTVLTKCKPPSQFQLPDCGLNICNYLALFSSSQTNLHSFSSYPIFYRYVTESMGDNFENGGIEHQYTVVPDMPGNNLLGDYILGAPLSNQSISGGKEITTYVFKKTNGVIQPVQKTFNHYKDDTRYKTTYSGYVINRKISPYCESNPPNREEQMAYDVLRYDIFTNWSYVDSSLIRTYDGNGQNYTDKIVLAEYGNISHGLQTKQSTYGSNGDLNVINSYYPGDISLTGSQEAARQKLIERNIISPVLRSQIVKNGSQLYLANTYYKIFSNGLVLPESNYIQTKANAAEKRVEFFKYNGFGSIIEQAKDGDIKTTYLYDYLSMYPIAEVMNADSSSIAYTSFEADVSGNWTVPSSVRDNTVTITGKKSYSLSNGAVSKTSLSTTKTYTVSYWSRNGVQAVSGTAGVAGSTINGWTYYEHTVVNPAGGTIAVSGTGIIDELRLYPKGAFMTTYTYEPLVGITSQCDANNKILYYEYDTFSRLKLIRDQDGNIVKTFDYKYQEQQ